MESLKKLEEVMKEVQRDLRAFNAKEPNLLSQIESLELRKTSLLNEVEVAEARKKEAQDMADRMMSEKEKEFRARNAEIDKREDGVKSLQAANVSKAQELERKMVEAFESKIKYDNLYEEYSVKLAELKEKQKKAAEILG